MDTTRPLCPYLGSRDGRETQVPAIEYPSFENHCFATSGQDSPLLTHQATFCVGGNHALCPRHQALHGAGLHSAGLQGAGRQPSPPPAGAARVGMPQPVPADYAGVDGALFRANDPTSPGQAAKWLLFSMALVFLLVIGGVTATFAGWQLVSRGLVDLPDQLQAAAPAGVEGSPVGPNDDAPLVVIVTATNTPVYGGNSAVAPLEPTPTPTFAFPEAVTATPTPEEGGNTVPGVIGGPVVSTPTAAPGQNPSTPTRRPTPTIDLTVPTSTPTPAQTATPTRPLATPVVTFTLANQALPAGGCTIAAWRVENVRAVFFGDTGVNGQGERRICIVDEPVTVVLSVLLLDGSERTYPLTVDLILPTNTPAPTATFTPVLTPTPTWTPSGTRTATPEPVRYGVELTAEGGSVRTCTAGQTCTINLSVANTGSLADELFVVLVGGSPWPVQLCRQDNTCSGSTVSVGVAAGGARPITLLVTVPASLGETGAYQLRAESGNSGRTEKSAIVTVRITSQ